MRPLLLCLGSVAWIAPLGVPDPRQEAARGPRAPRVAANGDSGAPSLSADGRWIAFESVATNLVEGDTNGVSDVFLHDRELDTTERISISTDGEQGSDSSRKPAISADGRFVAFLSDARELSEGAPELWACVYVRDREHEVTTFVAPSVYAGELEREREPGISADGRFVAFASSQALTSEDDDAKIDVFVFDRVASRIELISVNGTAKRNLSECLHPAISTNGRFVVFDSSSDTIDPIGDPSYDRLEDDPRFSVFVRDRVLGTTSYADTYEFGSGRPLVAEAGLVAWCEAEAGSGFSASSTFVADLGERRGRRISVRGDGQAGVQITDVSPDGEWLVLRSGSLDLACDAACSPEVYVLERSTKHVEWITTPVDAKDEYNFGSGEGRITPDGRFVVFSSGSFRLVRDDRNGRRDVFLRDRVAQTTTLVGVAAK